MDYDYQYLLKQIKNLSNKEHVISSSRAKSAEEITNGGLTFMVDTLRKYFAFKGSSLAEPVYLDPIGQKLINIKYINGVDVSRLISGITKGYGISITDKGNGVYEISVEENKFALIVDVNNRFNQLTTDIDDTYAKITQIDDLNNKFNDYTTTTDLEKNYAKITQIDDLNNKFNDYTTTKDLNDKLNDYATIEKLNDYTTTTDLEKNYMKKSDVIPPTDSQFDLVKGFSYYTVKNNDITYYSPDDVFPLCNIMKIKLPDELIEQLTVSTIDLNIFKITLRKEILLDYDGNILNDFIISYNHTTNKFRSPIIAYNATNKCNALSYLDRDNPEILFDCNLSFIPNTEYLKGELIIEYLLNQDSIVSKQPTIKCDIIDSRNSLILRESDTHYFYKPDIISYNKDVKYINDDDGLEWSCECYQMIYKLPTDYTIPDSLEFSFKEYCFNNSWSLKWNKNNNTWVGNNIKGRRSPRVLRKCNMRNTKDDYGATGCYCMVKKDDWNKRHIPDHTNGLAYSLFNTCSTKGKMETKILFNDGRTEQAINYDLSIGYSSVLRGAQYNGYDLVSVNAIYRNYSTNTINVNDIEAITVDLTLPNDNTPNTLTFSVSGVHHDEVYNRGHLDIIGANDTIDVVSGSYTQRSVDITNSRDIILYLHKDYVDPREEISWDPTINPFVYIIQHQYYEVLPNPNAATTLYTDYNITSSKIITADNITTMRSDLNIVTNTVDVVAYDVSDIKVRVDVLDSEMAETQKVTQHLQEDIDNVRVISNVALAFGVIGTVGSITSIGMQLAPQGIQFFTKLGSNMLRNFTKGAAPKAVGDLEGFTLFQSIITRSIITDITPILEWCEEEYKELPKIAFDDELDDPDVNAVSLTTTLDICNAFRATLKPFFKLLANRINEVTEEVNSIDVTDQLTGYVAKTDLVRDDIIDVVYSFIDNTLLLTFEDEVVNGLLVFKVYGKVPEEDSVNNGTAKFYIKLTNKTLSALTPIDAPLTITDPGTNKDITIGGITDSGSIKSIYLDKPTMNGNVINIPVKNGYKIISINIEHNSFTRHMAFTVNDIAYSCDIVALKKQIESINQANAVNDLDVYATVDEVNSVLVNNYVQKKDLPEQIDMKDYRKINDLVVPSNTINYTTYEEEPDWYCYTIDKYVDGMRIVGVIHYPSGTDEPFDINFVNEGSEEIKYCTLPSTKEICIIESDEGYFIYARTKGDSEHIPFNITSITYGGDYLALKSECEELREKIAVLEQQLITNKPFYTWKSYYTGYTKIDMVDARHDINFFVNYAYNTSRQQLSINHRIQSITNFYNDLLCILVDSVDLHTYIHLNFVDHTIKVDEINTESVSSFPMNTTSVYYTVLTEFSLRINSDAATRLYFKEVYGKYIT